MKNRREFLKKASVVGATGMLLPNVALGNILNNKTMTVKHKPKILFFDVNETLLDLTKMKQSVGDALGGRTDLLPLWFTTMLQYSLVETTANQYNDFGVIGTAALQMVARNNGIELAKEDAKQAIVGPLRSIPPHPDVVEGLTMLKDAGYTLVSFTNSSYKGVATQFENAGLTSYFKKQLSIESIGKFKPHADAYAWAARQMNIAPKDAMLIAAHGWDIAGAIWAGWQGAFVNRPGAQLYPNAPEPQLIKPDIIGIAKSLKKLA